MAFRISPRFFSGFWSPLRKLNNFFVTLGGQPAGFRRPSWFLNLHITFSGLAKVAIFTTNVYAENQTLINHKYVCGALNRYFCQTRVISCPSVCPKLCPPKFALNSRTV